jgi:nucleotide-binding universal stress UspA family protein
MTTHGRTGPGRWIFGSVTEAVVAASPVPVLVLRAWQPLFGDPLLDENPKILVPLDGSAFAESAVDPAASFASDLRGQLVLLTVQDDPGAIREADDYLARVRTRVTAICPELAVSCEVRNGDPARAIEEAAAVLEAGLVFMATHGRTGPGRAVLGSVAGRVLQQSDVPVILRRPLPTEVDEARIAAATIAERPACES